ncbi:hypothetical protein EJB05_28714, partial [Eragrostis curvula]
MAAAIDDSCTRPGSIPFKWEICPGTPKHVRSHYRAVVVAVLLQPVQGGGGAEADAAAVHVDVAVPLPARLLLLRALGVHVAVQAPAAPPDRVPRRRAPGCSCSCLSSAPAAFRCFPLPVFRRRDSKKGGAGSSRRRSAASSSSSRSSFRSDGAPAYGGLRRSASSSSSSCLSLSSRSSNKFAEPREMEASTGWFV